MALESRSKTIGDYEYTVTQLPADRGRRAVTRFGKLIMPALADVAKAVGNTKGKPVKVPAKEAEAATSDDADESKGHTMAAFASALERVAENVTEEDMEFFCEAFASSTSVRGGDYESKTPKLSGIFAIHFAGKYDEMLEWLLFCFEVNFGSFFARLGLTRGTSAQRTE